MNQISLDAVEMKNFLLHIVNNNRYIQQQGKNPVSTEIIGPSGLGKTSIALQLANELGLNFVKLNLAQIEELGDLIGFPIREFQVTKADSVSRSAKPAEQKFKFEKVLENGKMTMKKVPIVDEMNSQPPSLKSEVWVDENAIENYIKNGYALTGKKRMSYCPPEWIADKKGGGILILDDWNRSD